MTTAIGREINVKLRVGTCARRRRRLARACALLAFSLVAAPARPQTDRELLDVCLDSFEGERRRGRLFTGIYGRHVLDCNYQVDMLEGYDERRAAYERWRTELHEKELARLAARPAPAPRPARRPAPALDDETVRYARCLRRRADQLAIEDPSLATDPRRARQHAELLVEKCLDEVGLR